MGLDLWVHRNGPWVVGPKQSGLRRMAACGRNLNALADSLGVASPDDFLDPASFEFSFYGDIHVQEPPDDDWLERNRQWFDPAEAIRALQAFIAHFQANGPEEIAPLEEPLDEFGDDDGDSPPSDADLSIYDPIPIRVADLLEDLEECLELLQTIEKEKGLFCFELRI